MSTGLDKAGRPPGSLDRATFYWYRESIKAVNRPRRSSAQRHSLLHGSSVGSSIQALLDSEYEVLG